MGKIDFEKDNVERENESSANVIYNVQDDKQLYHKKNCSKGVEKHMVTKYKTGGRGRFASRSSAGRTGSIRRRSRSAAKSIKATSGRSQHSGHTHDDGLHHMHDSMKGGMDSIKSGMDMDGMKSDVKSYSRRSSSSRPKSPAGRRSSKAKSRIELSGKCYEVRRSQKRPACVKAPIWQNGKYVRDECGSGIIPRRFNFLPSRRIWCKTPLSMYQATIGELARKILCREKMVPRDVKPAPPCNVEEYILPLCRGYYRKYDCLRPCEEDYAYYKGSCKQYRDRVQRYWEPCIPKDQKYHLDITEYAPQNAFLGKVLRRNNEKGGDMEPPCW